MLFFLILLNLIVVTSTTGNWHQLDGIEYYIEYRAVIGVDKAKEGCKAMNAILAAVKSQRIQEFLVRNVDNSKLTGLPYSFYIGLSRTGKNTLQWSDGTTTDTSVFTYWDGPDDVYHSIKLCVTMGWDGGLNGFKWKIVRCGGTHRYICQRNEATTTTKASTTTSKTTTSKLPTTLVTTEKTTTSKLPTTLVTTEQKTTTDFSLTSKQISTEYIATTITRNISITMGIENTPAIVNKANSSGMSAVGYAMIGVGAIVVLVICGIIYIKYYRNNGPTTTDGVNQRNPSFEKDDGPVVVDNVLYGTSGEPIQEPYEKAGKVDPVYSCADASPGYVAPNVEFHAETTVYDCTPDNACTENGQNETNDNSREDPSQDVYAQVVKQKRKSTK